MWREIGVVLGTLVVMFSARTSRIDVGRSSPSRRALDWMMASRVS